MTRVWLTVLAVAACVALACDDDPPGSPEEVVPEFGDPCQHESCSDQGLCVAEDDAPMCLCEPGYHGARCSKCESGFHLDALDRCAPDRSCAKQEKNPCGDHGGCDDSTGVIACHCDTGYEGPRCTLCQSGWARNDWGECLQVVLGGGDPDALGGGGGSAGEAGDGARDGGPDSDEGCSLTACNGRGTCDESDDDVRCTCDAGYSGAKCDACAAGRHRDATQQCVLDETCGADSCGGHGDCSDDGGMVQCTCAAGYSGTACDACAPGFHQDDGACVLDVTCLSTTCDGHGSCSSAGDAITCTCQAAYAGPNCTTCAGGYHRGAGDACVIDETCSSTACGPHGNCTLDDGEIECECDAGYAGDTCAVCAPGFHGDGSSCELDDQCQATSCPEHSECHDDGGNVSCACDAGYSGTLCDACAPGYYRFFAAGTCIVYDCHENPIDAAGSETFESFSGYPTSNNTCVSNLDLSSFELELSSIDGDGTVWACAGSSFYDLDTRHAMLEAGVLGSAALRFTGPIGGLQFDYGAQTALDLDISADGVSQRTIVGPRWSEGTVSLTFSSPVSLIEFHSSGSFTNQIALDNIAFTPPPCP